MVKLRRRGPRIILAILLTAALAVGIAAVWQAHRAYIFVDGTPYRSDLRELDLSGRPVQQVERLAKFPELRQLDLRGTGLTHRQYDLLRAALPECQIRWDPLFQGQYLSDETRALTISSLTEEEIAQLDYFPLLRFVFARDCANHSQLLALQQRRPECRVIYDVTIAGQEWDSASSHLVLSGADTEQIADRLPYLPHVEDILLVEPLPPAQNIEALQQAFPQIHIHSLIDICGATVPSDAREIDLSGIPMEDLSAVERAIPYLPGLQTVTMCGCGIPNEDMAAINQRYGDIRFIWSVQIGSRITLRTDVTAFMPYQWGVWLTDKDCYNLRYCTDMICLDLGHHEITSCEFVAFMPNIQYLLLADTNIRDISPLEGLTKLVYLELFMTQVTDYTPLLTCTALEDLNLCHTHGQAEVIAQMTWLKRLWWGYGNGGLRYYLQSHLPNTYIELDTFYSTAAGWRKGQRYYEQRDLLGMWYMD